MTEWENWWEHGEYDGTSCAHCGRERVMLATAPDGTQRRVCEKCGWDQVAGDYATTLNFEQGATTANPADVKVDLHRPDGSPIGGIVTLRNGMVGYSVIVGQDEDGDYEMRFEHAHYLGYTRDGLRCHIAWVDGKKRWVREAEAEADDFDIVAFERRAAVRGEVWICDAEEPS